MLLDQTSKRETAFRVIPVIDIQNGQAVHAKGGNRKLYQPLRSYLLEGSRPEEVAKVYRDRFGFDTVYVADLDAIESRPTNRESLQAIAKVGVRILADLGIRNRADLNRSQGLGIDAFLLGLETLDGPDALVDMAASELPEKLVFSLDLRACKPVFRSGSLWPSAEPIAIAEQAIVAGFRQVLLLDLERIGTGRGTGLAPLVVALRNRWPDLEILVGGGIAGIADLLLWKALGVQGVLVGSALLDGQIQPTDLIQLQD